MLPLAAYADTLSVRPGQTISFKVSNATGAPVSAEIVRVICADPNPAGPGIKTESVSATLDTDTPAQAWPVRQGSYGIVEGVPELGDAFTATAFVMPTLRTEGRKQTIISREGMFSLALDPAGRLLAEHVGAAGDRVSIVVGPAIPIDAWALVWLVRDPGSRELRAGWTRINGIGDTVTHPLHEVAADPFPEGVAKGVKAPLLFAARMSGDHVSEHFNGRIESPRIWTRALSAADMRTLSEHGNVPRPVGDWNFSLKMETSEIVDTALEPHHGRLVNTPTRAVCSSGWTGKEMCWRHSLEQYAAIHFHEDDIDDCHWPTTYLWKVPEGTKSSQYALMLKAGDASENVPFFVVPPKGKRTADLAVLVSTFTYTIYGNHARPNWWMEKGWKEAWRAQTDEWKAYPHNPNEHPEYGWSTYNDHTDGSGVAIVSWHRPMLNVRIGYMTYPNAETRASGLRHYPADSHLTAWLEAKGYDYDIVTDWELHTEGVSALEGYRVVTTGSHPEYHTRQTLDALEAYRDGGGRFMYLGGNGFYWKIATSPEKDGVLEIRRAEGGIRAWAAEPGEYYNQFDGEYGGMWRRNGRPPQHLSGVGFTAQGAFDGSHYRIRPDARGSRVGWILDGIEGDTFGDHGLSAHGAAGFELDRTDKRLGTPEHAVVVASSEGHDPDAPWELVPEERLTHVTTWARKSVAELIRADMTFFEAPNGGAVFSTGSITFCGSLPTNNFDNDVSRILQNVLGRFLDPNQTFEMPSASD